VAVPIGAVPGMVVPGREAERRRLPIRSPSESLKLSPVVDEALRLGTGMRLAGAVVVKLTDGNTTAVPTVVKLIPLVSERDVEAFAPDDGVELGTGAVVEFDGGERAPLPEAADNKASSLEVVKIPVPMGTELLKLRLRVKLGAVGAVEFNGGGMAPFPEAADENAATEVAKMPIPPGLELLRLGFGVTLAGVVAVRFADGSGRATDDPLLGVIAIPPGVEKTPVPVARELFRVVVGIRLAEAVSETLVDGGAIAPENPVLDVLAVAPEVK
jgi:hypothetical protein